MAGKSHDGCLLTDPHKKLSRPIFLSKKTSRESLFFTQEFFTQANIWLTR